MCVRVDIERAIGVTPIETVSVHPLVPLYDACRRMLKSRARRIPLIDLDDETQQEMVVSVLTQFRILKFVAVNVRETQMLRKPISELGIGTYDNVSTANMETPVINVIHQLVEKDISSVPIVDNRGMSPPFPSIFQGWAFMWVYRSAFKYLRVCRRLNSHQRR
jgi:5'-AMP-activated protein kinase regulatory gamma subunit